jgi:putative hydrolase of the HAD superfamily
MIKHISFDLWLTLIRSNSLFKRKRAELIADTCNSKGLSVSQIDTLIKNRDKIFDRYNEMKGVKIPAQMMYCSILKELSTDSRSITEKQVEAIRKQSEELFIEYPPGLVNEYIFPTLNKLKEEDKVLNISSNTGFMEGNILRKALKKIDLLHYFSFCIFSDEVKTSKPSANFFQQVYEKVNVSKSQVLHVGDNPKADYKGAIDFGFKALLITDTNYTIDDIRTGF